ncbi:MAG: hypothetical protein AXA67_00530 [Methylothermaceae bacteria B42]|nr:MAG: hypothetical protein AXA67_00530 [Methylothermaceae bacteria B42]HHJ38799.1 GGDEF domain-containing protein [Methylothermaceae bacterium]
MRREHSNLAVIENPAFSKKVQPDRSKRLKLLQVMQTTLALDHLLSLFSEEIQQWLPHDGFRYRNQKFSLEISGGKQSMHSCNYTLTLDEESLGELTVFRRKRFSDAELKRLENLLSNLFYPLRNALTYYQALQSAYTDPLTGLYNRTALNDAFQREWKLAQRQRQPLSLLALDIDHFKKINDTYGHAAGDIALIKIAEILRKTVRASDLVFRHGGEEFLVLLNNTGIEGAKLLAERIRKAIAAKDCSDIDPELSITTSIGVASLNHPEETPQQLLKRADEALYRAKRNGRNLVVAG